MGKKQRCAYEYCSKKLKLTDWPCKCQLIFCDIHRPPEKHECNYNFKNDKIFLKKCISKKIEVI